MKSLLKSILSPGAVQDLRKLVEVSVSPFKARRAARVGSRLVHYRPDRKTVLFFAPEGGVRLYLIVQAVIGKTLQLAGYNAIFIRCYATFPRCPVKDSVQLPYDASAARHAEICLGCHDQTLSVLDKYDLDYLDVRELLHPDAWARISKEMASLPPDRLTYGYESIQVGRLAFYDFSIAVKFSSDNALGDADLVKLDSYIENCLVSIEAVKAAKQRIDFHTVACFDEYAMMSCVRQTAKSQGAQVLRMISVAYHLNGDPRHIVAMGSPTIIVEQAFRAAQWRDWSDLPLPASRVGEIADDLIFRLTGAGAHIYSPNKTQNAQALFRQLGLSTTRKLLVAFPSSRDEIDAIGFNLEALNIPAPVSAGAFASQFEWLDELVRWTEASADYQLVIRIHPRVGATPRDGVRSSDYDRYRARFGGDFRHCKIVWPEEKISSYDLAELAHCALISWSTMGLELARFGLPVVSGHTSVVTIAPPGERFIRIAAGKEEYFRQIVESSGESPRASAQALLRAYRWYNLFYLGNAIDVSDLQMNSLKLPPYRLPRRARQIEEVMVDGREAIEGNLQSMKDLSGVDAGREEVAALKGHVGRLLVFLLTGEDRRSPVHLGVKTERSSDERTENTLVVNGQRVTYHFAGGETSCDSPLAARLAGIHAALSAGQ
jgi:hypothetical protein